MPVPKEPDYTPRELVEIQARWAKLRRRKELAELKRRQFELKHDPAHDFPWLGTLVQTFHDPEDYVLKTLDQLEHDLHVDQPVWWSQIDNER